MKLAVNCYLTIIFCFCSIVTLSQNLTNEAFGKGLTLLAEDSSFHLKMGFRFQTLYIGEQNINLNSFNDRLLIICDALVTGYFLLRAGL